MICTFFGHRDAPLSIEKELEKIILSLISEGVDEFLVGNNGSFDLLVQGVLRKLFLKSEKIRYSVVISYLNERVDERFKEKVIYPEGLEMSPKKIAIIKRNEWMLKRASVAVVYVKYTQGSSYKLLRKAERSRIRIINLATEPKL
ncbi:MAG: hypothetical protein IJW10_06765 [Clostridia bacterium]|nr:hypothetical protein [Clostridia bacterium]